MRSTAVIGLGHVGLPLASAFDEKRPVVGFDIGSKREVSAEELTAASELSFTDFLDDIADCMVFIVIVPTPIDHNTGTSAVVEGW